MFYERACQEQTSTSAAGLPLLRRELPSAPGFLSCFLSALRAAAVVPFPESGLLQPIYDL
jgi:hypothetical protein